MDRRERIRSHVASLQMALDSRQTEIWTAMPGIVNSFNAEHMTAEVQVAISGRFRNPQGVWVDTPIPLLLDCPVQFPGAGGFSLTFPVTEGDECLVVFASRCVDAWWERGGVQVQAEYRMHDLSDGFVLLGFRSVPRVLSDISTTTTQLRSDDGATFVEVASDHVNVTAPNSIHLTAPVVTITASDHVTVDTPITTFTGVIQAQDSLSTGTSGTFVGNILVDGDAIASGISLVTHVHSGVQGGPSDTGPPVP